MVSEDTKVNRLELGNEWLDTSDACRVLDITPKQLTSKIRPMLTHQSRSMRGKGARCVGYAYSREDIERCAAIKLALGYTALDSARVLRGIRVLGDRGMLRNLETQLPIDLHARVKNKRRRQ